MVDFINETWALSQKGRYESNGKGWLSSTTGAYRFNEQVDVIGNIVKRHSDQYKDGNGDVVRWTGEDVISGYGKVTLRPADGHELKLGAVIQDYDDVISGSNGSSSAERPGVGYAIYDTGSNESWLHNADGRFPMASTFKVLLCAAILAKRDGGDTALAHAARLNKKISSPTRR